MDQTLTVRAIEQGSVIDHIPSGMAISILNLLQLNTQPVTVGLNLPSERQGMKDIIKLHGECLNTDKMDLVATLAPGATCNQINNFIVTEKIILKCPEYVSKPFFCVNTRCITHIETALSRFKTQLRAQQVWLNCTYCEQTHALTELLNQ